MRKKSLCGKITNFINRTSELTAQDVAATSCGIGFIALGVTVAGGLLNLGIEGAVPEEALIASSVTSLVTGIGGMTVLASTKG